MFTIVDLNDRQVEDIESRLSEFDRKHDACELSGDINIGIMKDNSLIAGASACITVFKILYVSTVFVDEAYRNKGVGKLLMDAIEERALKLDAEIIRLDTFNFQGPEFYTKLGYEQVGFYKINNKYSEFFFMKKLI